MERIPQTEICPKCGEEKGIREFFVFRFGTYTEGGATVRERKVHCRKCRAKARAKIWRRDHAGRVKKNNHEYYKRKQRENI